MPLICLPLLGFRDRVGFTFIELINTHQIESLQPNIFLTATAVLASLFVCQGFP